jgi:tRNA pseudouridine55 synthase
MPVLRVRCSKGTYIRTLVEDLAAAAGTVAHVAELRRLSVGGFAEGSMSTLAAIEAAAEAGPDALQRLLLPPDAALGTWPAVRLDPGQAARIRHGQPIDAAAAEPGMVRLYAGDDGFLGVGERLADCRIVPRRLMTDPEPPAEGRFGL